MAKEKTTGFFFKMSPEESELFEQRMALTGIRNKSAFIRKMCIDGHVFNLDMPVLNEIKRLLGITANNVNQISRRVNSGGDAYREDVAEVNSQLTEIRSDFGKLLAVLSEIASAKPGKRFIAPPTIRDLPEYAEQHNDSEGGGIIMATTAIIPLHTGKGRTVATALGISVNYVENPEKTDSGEWITSYQCDPLICDQEFMFSKNQYAAITGRDQGGHDVIGYHLRISFKPGETDAATANRIGYELAMKLTHGNHAFVCCTHTDKKHTHTHAVINSTSLDCTKKFRNFKGSAFAVRRIADHLCLENGLSIVENPKPSRGSYRDWQGDNRPQTAREKLCALVDEKLIVGRSFGEFLASLKKAGCEIKLGKHTAVRLPSGQRFIRFDSIGGDYSEQALRERCAGTRNIVKKSDSGPLASPSSEPEKPNLLIDIQSKMQQGYGEGFRHYATIENLKQSAKTLIYLKEVGIDSYEELISQYNSVGSEFDRRHTRLKEVEKRIADITEFEKQIGTYRKTLEAWDRYKKSGYDPALFEIERADLTLHKAAKKYFDEQGFKGKLPSMNSLKEEWGKLAQEKRQLYNGYKELRDRDRALTTAKYNIDRILNISPEELERQRQNHAQSHER